MTECTNEVVTSTFTAASEPHLKDVRLTYLMPPLVMMSENAISKEQLSYQTICAEFKKKA